MAPTTPCTSPASPVSPTLTKGAGYAGRFADDNGNVHKQHIERIAAAGLTHGCNPPDNTHYCPDKSVTRAQAASFFARLIDMLNAHAT